MATKIGTFYGVGVGPGDPELMTLKAVRVLKQCPVIAAPQTASGEMLALDIASRALPLEGKTVLPLPFTMARDAASRAAAHQQATALVAAQLEAGNDVAMLNLGDVSLYATAGYLMERLAAAGYATVRVPGVPSFCAVAARLGTSLTEMDAPLHILPGSVAGVAEGLRLPGSKILMKTGKQLPAVLAALQAENCLQKAAMVANCGLPGEEVWPDLTAYPPDANAGYFATILVKE
ncbi:MAG: precorrin-2 C(20)-methyltransferase [Gemmiger sp.]|nr:precorrin-2 C(20)-methyltransferase [Gemmiger sp.]